MLEGASARAEGLGEGLEEHLGGETNTIHALLFFSLSFASSPVPMRREQTKKARMTACQLMRFKVVAVARRTKPRIGTQPGWAVSLMALRYSCRYVLSCICAEACI